MLDVFFFCLFLFYFVFHMTMSYFFILIYLQVGFALRFWAKGAQDFHI